MLPINKIARGIRYFIKSRFYDVPLFLHVCPTRNCNLKCSYCYQNDYYSEEMSIILFKKIIDNLYLKGLSIVSFTGGEPLVWKEILEGIEYCNSKNILVQLTSNGTLLSKEKIIALRNAGLDYLMVSIDAYRKSIVSQKTINQNPNILYMLNFAREVGLAISVNSVVTNENYSDIMDLITLTNQECIPISLGMIVEPPNNIDKWNGDKIDIYTLGCEYNDFVKSVIKMKKDGYLIIEPIQYFEGYKEFKEGKVNWDCSIAKRSTIQVAPNGKVYLCSKLNEMTEFNSFELSDCEFTEYKKMLYKRILVCNKVCYSNCSYNSFYYHENIFEFIKLFLKMYKYKFFKVRNNFLNNEIEQITNSKRSHPQKVKL